MRAQSGSVDLDEKDKDTPLKHKESRDFALDDNAGELRNRRSRPSMPVFERQNQHHLRMTEPSSFELPGSMPGSLPG